MGTERERLSAMLLIAMGAWSVFALQYAVMGRWATVSIDVAVVVSTGLVHTYALSAGRSRLVFAAHAALAVSVLGLVAAASLSGASDSLAVWYLVAAPLFAAHARGTRAAVAWSGIGVLAVVLVHAIGELELIEPEFLLDRQEMMVGRTFLVVVVLALGVASRRVLENQADKLRAKSAALAEETLRRGASENWQRQFRELLDEGADMIFVADAETGAIVDANLTSQRLLGFGGERLVGREASSLFGDLDDLDDWKALVGRVSRRGALVEELTLRTREGTPIPSEVAFRVVKREADEFVVALARDIRERRRVERMREQMVSIVSHELRTPLTAMKGALALANSGVWGEEIPPKTSQLLEMAHRNAERLARLTDDLLELKSIETGASSLERSRFSLSEFLTRAVEEQRDWARERGVKLKVYASESAVRVHADPDRLAQVVANLISNAIKFSNAGDEVSVHGALHDASVAISVEDRGPGIRVEDRQRIFEPFVQADAGDDRPKAGTGLGLAISRAIAEQHGGRLTLQSEVGKGSRFTVEIPKRGWDD